MNVVGKRMARTICARYYLDLQPVSQIARELGVSREDVRDAVDDPKAHEEFLQRADKARARQKIRNAMAAEIALDRQVGFLQADVGDELQPTQQHVAENVLRRALPAEKDSPKDIRIRFVHGEIPLGMPEGRPGEYEERGENGL